MISGELWTFLQCVLMAMPGAVPRAMLGHGPRHGLRHGTRHGQRYKAIYRSFQGDFRRVFAVPWRFKVSFGHFWVISGEGWPFLRAFGPIPGPQYHI